MTAPGDDLHELLGHLDLPELTAELLIEDLPGSLGSTRPAEDGPERLLLEDHPVAALLPQGILGIDVSHYQSINVHAQLRPRFAIVKASEATSGDSSAVPHAQAARQVGATVGAYHFLRAGNGAGQAAVFLRMAAAMGLGRDTRLWADYESGDLATLRAFLTTLEQAGYRTGIYTGGWFWGPNGSRTDGFYAARPLWLSGYTSSLPPIPGPWSTAAIWQFTDRFGGLSLDGNVTGTLDWIAPGDAGTPPPSTPATPGSTTTEVNVSALPTLTQGSSGQYVRNLQGLLVANGQACTVDGSFGGGTKSALASWQGRAGLGADGIAGHNTWSHLLGVPA